MWQRGGDHQLRSIYETQLSYKSHELGTLLGFITVLSRFLHWFINSPTIRKFNITVQ